MKNGKLNDLNQIVQILTYFSDMLSLHLSKHPHAKTWGLCFVAVRLLGKDLHLLHRGTQGSPQNVYRSVDIPIVVRTTFGACPLSIRK